MQDLPLIISLISLGFFGGFSHCIGMCGPFVLTQVTNRLQQTSLAGFSQLQKLQNLALLPYHLGRITSYSIIGLFCSLFTQTIEDFVGFKIISTLFLTLAILFFAQLLFAKNSANLIKTVKNLKLLSKINLPFKSKILKTVVSPFTNRISTLFKKPYGLNGYFLGIILGFIPCGLLYGAFLIAATISNPILAAIGMMFFGIATFPSLFLTACGGSIIAKIPEFKFITKLVILINIITLSVLVLKINL